MILAVKAVAAVPGGVLGLLLIATETPVYVGGGGVVVGFAALFLRQFFKNQAATWAIATERKQDLERERNEHHFTRWQLANAHFQLGIAPDPGPYSPRPKDA